MTADNAAPFFELDSLAFAYSGSENAVAGVSLRIGAGEMAAIIGPNGAGKSTLLHLMVGLLAPASGRALIQGRDAAAIDPRERARLAAFVPQAARVMFPYTVREIVAMGRHPHIGAFGAPSLRDRERIDWAMEATDTARFAARTFNQLSGGEAQRAIIARALAQDAPALLLDEPTASLDLYHQSSLYGLLETLNREHGLTVVTVTHDVNLAAEYCPRLIGMRGGRMLMDGPPEEIVEPEKIEALYGVKAEVVSLPDGRFLRLRQGKPGNRPPAAPAPR